MRTTTHRWTRTALALLVAPLLMVSLAPSAARADVTDRDPELRSAPASSTDAGRTGAARRAPASIDSDVYASVTSPTLHSYFVAAGHLKLELKSGSTTKYSGSFTDYSGQKTTKASADASEPDAPTVSITTANGSFTFRGTALFGSGYWGGTSTKVPKKIGFKADDLSLAAAPHLLKTLTYQLVVSERVGPVAKPFEYAGSITMSYDANNRVSGGSVTVVDAKGRTVTNPIRSTGFVSAGSYFYTVVKVDKTTMGISATFSGSGFSGYAVSGSGSKTALWVVSGTA